MIRKWILAATIITSPLMGTDQVSEAFGNFLGRSLANRENELPLNISKVIEGMKKGYAGEPSPLSEKDYQLAINELQQTQREMIAKDNLEKAEEYLQKTSEDSETNTLVPLKLYYTLVEPGDGATVEESATPLIHYTGKFIDGKIFGSSEESGPIALPLASSIPGFRMGLVGMLEGEKRRLYIHPDLAYGTNGELPPNSLLIFDVEILKADATESDS